MSSCQGILPHDRAEAEGRVFFPDVAARMGRASGSMVPFGCNEFFVGVRAPKRVVRRSLWGLRTFYRCMYTLNCRGVPSKWVPINAHSQVK
jgi:hypothetical protein